MIDWGLVAAFTGPLVGAIGLSASWFTYLARKRDERISLQIRETTAAFEVRISQVETALASQAKHLDKQDDALIQAMQAVARIEGRLAGPFNITQTTQPAG